MPVRCRWCPQSGFLHKRTLAEHLWHIHVKRRQRRVRRDLRVTPIPMEPSCPFCDTPGGNLVLAGWAAVDTFDCPSCGGRWGQWLNAPPLRRQTGYERLRDAGAGL